MSLIDTDAWPKSITGSEIQQLLENFLKLSNAPNHANQGDYSSEENFADLFDPVNGVYQLASEKAEGKEAIIALRKDLFTNIPNRHHTVTKIYTFGDDRLQLLLLGQVGYKHHQGHETGGDWTAEVVLTWVNGHLKIAKYQVIVYAAGK